MELWYRSLLVFLIFLAVALFSFFFFFFQSTHSQDSVQYISVLHATDVALLSLPWVTSHSIQWLRGQGASFLQVESHFSAVSPSSNLCANVQASVLSADVLPEPIITCAPKSCLGILRSFSNSTCPKWDALLFWRKQPEVEISSNWQGLEISLRN